VTIPPGGGTFTAQYAAQNDGSQNPPTSPDLTAAVLPPRRPTPSAVAGAPGRVTVRLTNNGATAVNAPVGVALAVSPDGFLDPEDPVTTTVQKPLRLNPGKSRNVVVRFVYPDSLENGAYVLLARADAGGTVAEKDETNNVGAAPAPVNIAQPFVDLSGAFQAVRPGRSPLRQVGATLLVRNGGNVAVNGPVTLLLLASADTTADDSDVSLGTLTRTFSIKPNSAKRLTLRLPLPAGLAAGTYHVIARLGSAGTVTESNDTNNDVASGGTFTVG
jgi:hypothetical protein